MLLNVIVNFTFSEFLAQLMLMFEFIYKVQARMGQVGSGRVS